MRDCTSEEEETGSVRVGKDTVRDTARWPRWGGCSSIALANEIGLYLTAIGVWHVTTALNVSEWFQQSGSARRR